MKRPLLLLAPLALALMALVALLAVLRVDDAGASVPAPRPLAKETPPGPATRLEAELTPSPSEPSAAETAPRTQREARAAVVRGVLISPATAGPVADARVLLIYDRLAEATAPRDGVVVRPSFQRRTDARGQFEFPIEVEGSAHLLVLHDQHRDLRHELGPLTVAAPPGSLELVLDPGERIQGRVLDPKGAPYCGAMVTATGLDPVQGAKPRPRLAPPTDVEGRFTVSALDPGPYALSVTSGSRAERSVSTAVDRERDEAELHRAWRAFLPSVPAGSHGVELRFQAGIDLEGRVLGLPPGQSCIVRAMLAEERTDGPIMLTARPTAGTAADGAFRFVDLDAGAWILLAQLPDARHSRPVRVQAMRSVHGIELVMSPPATVSGRVRLENGEWADRGLVQWRCEHEASQLHTLDHDARVSPDGTFVVKGCPPGVGRLQAEVPGVGTSAVLELALAEGETRAGVELTALGNGKGLPRGSTQRTVVRGRN